MNKKIITLFSLYAVQILSSCFPTCPESKVYELTYNDVKVESWNTSGFENIKIEEGDTINKCSFGLTIFVQSETKEIVECKTKIKPFGMEPVMALSCVEDEYIYTNRIESIEIFVIDVETSEMDTITNNFSSYTYYGERITLTDLLEADLEKDYFRLDLIECENIPNASIFKVNVHLDSGNTLSRQTEQINFYD
jgi:hypothetical protein